MAAKDEKSTDFYGVLGLEKECTEADLRNAYKKLALRWHPDRCSAMGNSKYVEEAKNKFQAIQNAYSVLSDPNKRFMYDVGVYDCDDDDDENGMGDFLNEMAVMMSQHKSNENGEEESFEELKNLFEDMFQSEIEALNSSSQSASSCSSLFSTYGESSNKRDSSQMNLDKSKNEDSFGFDTNFRGFCFGVELLENSGERAGGKGGSRRSGRKQKVSTGHDVSFSTDYLPFLLHAAIAYSTCHPHPIL